MSLFIGSNQDDIITPDQVSPGVGIIGHPKKPSAGIDLIFAGDGNDLVAGGGGNDIVSLGAGDDTFVWNSGDGSDAIDGGEGFDTLRLTTGERDDSITLSKRTVQVRNEGTLLLDNVEWLELATGNGRDSIVVDSNLRAASIQSVRIDLTGSQDPLSGDGELDSVRVEGGKDSESITVFGFESSVAVLGTPTFVDISGADATDRVIVNGNGGDDFITAYFADGGVGLTLDGGSGDDEIVGSQGNDILIGGKGNDFITGGQGSDTVDLGAGDDHFNWNPADGSDIVEGGAGRDSMRFGSSAEAESLVIAANGGRVHMTRDVGNVVMDVNDVESMTINVFGGADTVKIGDLSGTDLRTIELSLIGNFGQATDGQQDSVELAATAAADRIELRTENQTTTITGLAAEVRISGADVGLDRLQVNGGSGNDTIDASRLQANLLQLSVFGGDGDDVLIGGPGADVSIEDFQAGAGSEDRIDVRGLGSVASFDWLMSHASEVGGSTVLDFGDHQITLRGVALASLHQDDFLMA